MVLVQRLTLLAANLLDGSVILKTKKLEQEQSNGHSQKTSSALKLSAYQREYAVL